MFDTDFVCDRCSAAAKARYISWFGDLVFCGHHSRKHGPAIIERGGVFDVAYAEAHDPDLVPA